MIEIVVMIGVIGWFARTAKNKGLNGFLWAAVGAISYYGPVLLFGRLIYPELIRSSITYENQTSYMIIGILSNIAVGVICCLIARRALVSIGQRSDSVQKNEITKTEIDGMKSERNYCPTCNKMYDHMDTCPIHGTSLANIV
jgi:uncharacterized membrane protein YeaQ/YmgE (transglycosylase-associated protein family)